jgi:hypothetical protein
MNKVAPVLKHQAMDAWGKCRQEYKLNPSTLEESECSVSRPGHFTPVPIGKEDGWAPQPDAAEKINIPAHIRN